jgi:transcriptional regulator with XRE-family HTH domain
MVIWKADMPRPNNRIQPEELRAFGARLRLAREEAQLGVNELGRLSGTSGAVVTRLEHGDSRPPGAEIVIVLAKAMHVRPGWLLTGEEPMRPPLLRFVEEAPPVNRKRRK